MSKLFALAVLSSMLSCTSTTGPVRETGQLPSGMAFVSIPAGSFSMGAPVGEEGSMEPERPVHTVTFDYSFEMMTTEVTRAMWYEVMYDSTQVSDPVLPVTVIDFEKIQQFADSLNAIDPNHSYRLPSEAEWEYACRANTTTRFYWGEDPDYEEIRNYAQCMGVWCLQPVAQLIPNSWGLYDMSGNAWELCLDSWHDNYTGAPADGSAWGNISNESFVGRGGSFTDGLWRLRSAHRYRSGSVQGFRLVRM